MTVYVKAYVQVFACSGGGLTVPYKWSTVTCFDMMSPGPTSCENKVEQDEARTSERQTLALLRSYRQFPGEAVSCTSTCRLRCPQQVLSTNRL